MKPSLDTLRVTARSPVILEHVATGKNQPEVEQTTLEVDPPRQASTPPPPQDRRAEQWATPQIGRRVPLPSKRACAIVGIVAGLLDLAILFNDGHPILRSLFGAIFLAVFVYVGMRLMTGLRRRIRPDQTKVSGRETQSPLKAAGAPKGGWANPTGGQKLARRITRITANYGKRRPPRR